MSSYHSSHVDDSDEPMLADGRADLWVLAAVAVLAIGGLLAAVLAFANADDIANRNIANAQQEGQAKTPARTASSGQAAAWAMN